MNIYERTAREIADARRERLDAAQILWQSAIAQNDSLYATFRDYQTEMINAAQNKPNTLDAARTALGNAAKNAGLDLAALDPPFECETCRDTGRVGNSYCKCVIRRVIRSDRESLALPPADFDACRKTAPNSAIKKAYAVAQTYIDGFPNGKPFFIVFGAPGTGKTVLAEATVGALMQRGAAAVTCTAFDFMRRATDYHTQFAVTDYVDRFTPMLDCDALLIDDLGTESMKKNITKELLYTVVNERLVRNKFTIVTTNLTPSGINTRYGESIFSRLCDKRRAVCISVDSKNERLK